MLSLEKENGGTSHPEYYLPKVEIKDYNVKIDGRNLFNQPINKDIKTYENIRKTATGQGDDYTTGSFINLISKKIIKYCNRSEQTATS